MDWRVPPERALNCFPKDYAAARAAFLRAAEDRDAELHCFPVQGSSPSGDPLAIDSAWIGERDARAVLVLLSGTHGAEGYAGSAAQVDLLRNGPTTKGVAVLLVHALTPWGFAFNERTDEAGIDLNRNFVDHQSPPFNEGYAELADDLVPSDRSELGLARAEANIAEWRERHGSAAFDRVRRAGQYSHPTGLYYGGSAPAPGNAALATLFGLYGLARRRVAVVDWHTGLGPFGHGEIQSELPRAHRLFRRAQTVFGPELTSPFDGSSSSTVLNGTVQEGLFRLLEDNDHVYVCLEFGTFSPTEARKVLLDLALKRPGARAASRRYFFPDTPGWNEMVLWRSRQVVRRLTDHLWRDGIAP